MKTLKDMTLKEAMNEVSNEVYLGSAIVEELEHAGKIFGNGHHIRQAIAKFAEDYIRAQWIMP